MKALIRKIIFKLGLGSCYNMASVARRKYNLAIRNRLEYRRIIKRIRNYPRDRKIKVIFLVDSISKWKLQSLYDRMLESGHYDPIVALTICNDPCYWGHVDVTVELRKFHDFFEKRGCKCVYAYDVSKSEGVSLLTFDPDIIFFQEPFHALFPGQSVADLRSSALCCYIPYSAEYEKINGLFNIPWFHNLLFLNCALNNQRAEYLRSLMPWGQRSGMILGTGHTMFDVYPPLNSGAHDLVIYAPHFSIPRKQYERLLIISTFMWSGKVMLEYAKKHPEIKWAFKPHPRLRGELIETGGWTEAEVDEYYSEWSKIAESCFDGNYLELFNRSKAMITDCASFLLEYPATGRPLIHLRRLDHRPDYGEYMLPLLNSYYQVTDEDQLLTALKMVVESGEDPNKDVRLKCLRDLNVIETDAAGNVMSCLNKCLRIKVNV